MEDEELKSLLRRNLEVAQDTNHVVRAMNRRAFWGGALKFLWWFVILFLIPAIAYYVYLMPRLNQYKSAYSDFQNAMGQMQGVRNSFGGDGAFSEFMKKFSSPSTTTTQR